jgi:DNA-binding LytR/AlgR family response regulator
MTPINVLIVEDNLTTATELKYMLEDAGHKVTALTRNYNEAIESVKNTPPDIALLDIKLADSVLDGISTAKELVAIHQMPVIFISGYLGQEVFQMAKEVFPAAFLSKPYNSFDLLRQIELSSSNFQISRSGGKGEEHSGIFVRIKDGYEKILKKDIILLKADGVYTEIFVTKQAAPLIVSIGLGNLTTYLQDPWFFKLSRSMLVNLDFVKRIDKNYLYLTDQIKPVTVPLSVRKDLVKKLNVVRQS